MSKICLRDKVKIGSRLLSAKGFTVMVRGRGEGRGGRGKSMTSVLRWMTLLLQAVFSEAILQKKQQNYPNRNLAISDIICLLQGQNAVCVCVWLQKTKCLTATSGGLPAQETHTYQSVSQICSVSSRGVQILGLLSSASSMRCSWQAKKGYTKEKKGDRERKMFLGWRCIQILCRFESNIFILFVKITIYECILNLNYCNKIAMTYLCKTPICHLFFFFLTFYRFK